ncbi:hypothetical protein DFJ73DRAFT_762436 [Zopfochytrium polystomum]|nr:hypothetical protein DFJ73DRAFT_762436 [Zopfochytrium polystomum]
MSDIETKSESDVKLDDIEFNVQIVLLDIYKKMDKILDILNKLEMEETTSVKAKLTIEKPKELPSSSTTKATTSTPTCLGKTTKNLPCKRKPSSDPNIHPYCSTHVSQRKNVSCLSEEYVDDCE